MIHKMTISDYNDIYRLGLSCKGMGLNDVDDSKSGIARFLEGNPDTCFVAEKEGQTVRVIMAENDGRRGYIYLSHSVTSFFQESRNRLYTCKSCS